MITENQALPLDTLFLAVLQRWSGVVVNMHPVLIQAMQDYHNQDWQPSLHVIENNVVAPGAVAFVQDNQVLATCAMGPVMPYVESVAYRDHERPAEAYYQRCPIPGEQDFHAPPEMLQ